MKTFKLVHFSLVASIILVFSACSGGSDGGGVADSSSNTGYYVDSAVRGISYECGTKSGTTDSVGAFSFKSGVDCTFKAGGIILRETKSSDLTDGVTIVEDNIEVARFLQSMDMDGIAGNGIDISTELLNALRDAGKTSLPKTDTEIDDLIGIIKDKVPDYAGRKISLMDAKAHVDVTKQLLKDTYDYAGADLGIDGYLGLLQRHINPGTTFGWKTDTETDSLSTSVSRLDSKITLAKSDLADVDISSANQNKIDALISNKSTLSQLIQDIKDKNIQLDTAIRVGSSVADVNIIINEIKALAKGNVYDYFDDLAQYGRIPLPTFSANPDNNDQMQINGYLNQAGSSALSFVNSLGSVYTRMLAVSKAYTQSLQSKIKNAYDTTTDTNENSCSVANYTNSVVLDPQVIGQCQMAYFYTCAVDKYGSSYPDKVVDMQDNIKTVCSILDGYKDFTTDGTNPKDSCGYCDGVDISDTQINEPQEDGLYSCYETVGYWYTNNGVVSDSYGYERWFSNKQVGDSVSKNNRNGVIDEFSYKAYTHTFANTGKIRKTRYYYVVGKTKGIHPCGDNNNGATITGTYTEKDDLRKAIDDFSNHQDTTSSGGASMGV